MGHQQHLLSALSNRRLALDAQESDLRTLLAQAQRLRGVRLQPERQPSAVAQLILDLLK